jgi:hypothetical protein
LERTAITALESNLAIALKDVTIAYNPEIERVTFPNATRIGSLNAHDSPKLATLDFRSATSAVEIDVNTAGQVRLDALATADKVSVMYTGSVNLAALRTTTTTLRLSTLATNISLPELTSVGDHFAIATNLELLTLSVPKLRTVGNHFQITSNPKLPTCRAVAILGQLTSQPQYISINENNDSGVCN